MSFPLTFDDPDPSYDPDEFDFADNFNVLHISEVHAFEPSNRKDEYLQNVGEQIDTYSEMYEIDRVSILGDTGSIEDVEKLLEPVNEDVEVWMVAGDEDKKTPQMMEDQNEARYGWFASARSAQPFDIDNDYRIFDEGYETEIEGHTVQAAHHPQREKRDSSLSFPDPRAIDESEKPSRNASPEELFAQQNNKSFLETLFSVEQYSNENTEREPIPSMKDGDVFLYDHVHMPYARKIYDSAVIGLGGRSHNYQVKVDCMPLRSIHVTSFSEELVHAMHFDAQKDDIFEHQIFDFKDDDGLEIYNIRTPKSSLEDYLPIQSRFVKTQWHEDAYEKAEDYPLPWEHRDLN